jgi:predicted NBD/HSP70 family sugar kinase
MVYLSLSNSVGGAVYVGGRLFTGDDQRAGEFGHMCLIPKGETCYCGKQGCADAYLSALRLSEPYRGHLDAFFEALRLKDPKAKELFETYLYALAILVSSLRMAFDCTVILGGYVGGYLTPYLTQLRALSAAHDPFQPDEAYLQPCHFHYEASALGAALQYINRFITAS